MENVPWHTDVKAFSEALATRSQGEYEVACEHVHSCCVLLAKTDKFKINGQWFTWIDYEKFHGLVRDYNTSISSKCFVSSSFINSHIIIYFGNVFHVKNAGGIWKTF